MSEWPSAHPDAEITFGCVEIAPQAIRCASALNAPVADRIRFIEANAPRFRPRGKYDLIWIAGLFDYFNNRLFASMLMPHFESAPDRVQIWVYWQHETRKAHEGNEIRSE